MPDIDPRSIILLSGFMALLMSVVLFLLRRNFPPSIRGLSEWAAGPALMFVSAVLIGLRGAIPDLLSIVVGNVMLLVGLVLLYFGSQRFFGLPKSVWLWGSLVFAAAAVLLWTHVEPHFGNRVLLMAALMTLLSFSHLRLLLRHGTPSFALGLTATALALQTMAQAYRFTTGIGAPADDRLMIVSPEQTAVVAAYAVCMLMIMIGVVLMAIDKLRAEFERVASHDPLTGALTRRALVAACEQELVQSRRKDRVMSLLILELDDFAAINETYGRPAGNRVLVDFATSVMALLRGSDSLGRFGGAEFVVLLPETTLDEARVVAGRIRAEAAETSRPLACTASVGVASVHPDDRDVDALLTLAADALDAAKAAGGDRVWAAA